MRTVKGGIACRTQQYFVQVCQLSNYVRNDWSYTFTPAYAFVACQRTIVRVRGINNVRRLENCTAEPLVPNGRIGIETDV